MDGGIQEKRSEMSDLEHVMGTGELWGFPDTLKL